MRLRKKMAAVIVAAAVAASTLVAAPAANAFMWPWEVAACNKAIAPFVHQKPLTEMRLNVSECFVDSKVGKKLMANYEKAAGHVAEANAQDKKAVKATTAAASKKASKSEKAKQKQLAAAAKKKAAAERLKARNILVRDWGFVLRSAPGNKHQALLDYAMSRISTDGKQLNYNYRLILNYAGHAAVTNDKLDKLYAGAKLVDKITNKMILKATVKDKKLRKALERHLKRLDESDKLYLNVVDVFIASEGYVTRIAHSTRADMLFKPLMLWDLV